MPSTDLHTLSLSVAVLRDVVRAERGDAQTGKYHYSLSTVLESLLQSFFIIASPNCRDNIVSPREINAQTNLPVYSFPLSVWRRVFAIRSLSRIG